MTLTKSERREVTHLNRVVAQERRRARERGDAWTRYRAFLSGWERIGKARCGAGPGRHTPGASTVVVSYSAHFAGCVALCAAHSRSYTQG